MNTDIKYMQLAIHMAHSTIGQTSPNPSVGAVIVKNGKIIAIGLHIEAGAPHAEVKAIHGVANPQELDGSTLYVTLEPCCHVGKTSACTDLIIKHKIKRVVVATLDKNPLVAGNGIKQLINAGVEVTVGILEEQAYQINKKFFYYINKRLPYITLKAGLSLDAKYATTTGESQWITCAQARLDAHSYRSTNDAILIGINTALQDNPTLNTRVTGGGNQPIRIVLDSTLKISESMNLIQNTEAQTIIITGSNYNPQKREQLKKYTHVEIIHLDNPQIDLATTLEILAKQNITSILVEGGEKIHNSFIQNQLFNELVIYLAPSLIGGSDAPNFFNAQGFAKLQDAIKLTFTETVMVGTSMKIVATRL
ncbi:MAG: bifunctional diaminohydroxyphosphoribosylaminopyrimidine deaminase/5-amino-6-(5-phosphoribosylamino)uracil reductase RibD [Burkholderiales bacterium]|nr:bifunctional diaminohydroxyphosphoribosylaminopyrimidine deaminase/5-amino-6-(5-phosphoribosylamino)uracil reductase RibD [Burkholderiales bacterium]